MSTERAHLEQWLLNEFSTGLAAVFEGMAGVRPEAKTQTAAWQEVSADPANLERAWRQPLKPLTGAVVVTTSSADAAAAGQHVMVAAGVDDSSPEELNSTYQEALTQALAMLARAIGERVALEVTPTAGVKAGPLPPDASWGAVTLSLGDAPVTIHIGIESALLKSLETVIGAANESADAQAADAKANSTAVATAPGRGSVNSSKTFDLLLDVELPVSVSFGHAQVPLKDVLKLTTGSIVELSRAISEPVDVVVNNCVIARGEVVVIEGNFGVRIQQVASRNERLRSIEQ